MNVDSAAEPQHSSSRLRSAVAGTRDLVRLVHSDPDHLSERLTLKFVDRLGSPSLAWAEEARDRPDEDITAVAADLRRRCAQVARIDGAVAGTPFLIALVPGYMSYLWQEGVLTLRLAALYGHDPRGLKAASEFLVLRGIHPTLESAQAALEHIQRTPVPPRPEKRRPIRQWIRSVRMLGVFGGFLSPPSPSERPEGTAAKLRTVAGVAITGAIFVITWILPVTFMLAMSWGCESHARDLGRKAAAMYGGEEKAARERHLEVRGARRWLRSGALLLSVAVPIAFVAVADRVRNQTGVNAIGAAGAIVALSLVVAAAVVAKRA